MTSLSFAQLRAQPPIFLFFGFFPVPVFFNFYFPQNQTDIIGICMETDALSSSQFQELQKSLVPNGKKGVRFPENPS